MKKFFLILSVVLVLTIIVGFLFRQPLMFALLSSQISPAQDFDPSLAPSAPDYTQDIYWAALPSIADPSDQRPDGVLRSASDVAVFFVHPTSYFGTGNWNQPLDDADANWLVDQRILRHQASVFNSCCDIYAPRYRQATFFSFLDPGTNGAQAIEFAYTDVESAFANFLQRLDPEQPFILAGHSQGTRHATELLANKIADTPLIDRMVVAYLIGFSITYEQLGDVPACAGPAETGCAVGWNAIDGEGQGAFGATKNLLCTNPLSWKLDGEYVGHELNQGGIGYPTYGAAEEGEDYKAMQVEVGVSDAQCVDGQLVTYDLRSSAFPSRMMGSNSMHIYDYSLYHMNIRANVARRIAAFKDRQAGVIMDVGGGS